MTRRNRVSPASPRCRASLVMLRSISYRLGASVNFKFQYHLYHLRVCTATGSALLMDSDDTIVTLRWPAPLKLSPSLIFTKIPGGVRHGGDVDGHMVFCNPVRMDMSNRTGSCVGIIQTSSTSAPPPCGCYCTSRRSLP